MKKTLWAILLMAAIIPCGAVGTAHALLPAFEGQIHLAVDQFAPGAFGLRTVPAGTVFDASFLAVALGDGSVRPDGFIEYPVRMADFALTIGNTSWNETQIRDPFILLFGDGSVRGLAGEITPYDPGHADFGLLLPASPGAWWAWDLVGDIDNGNISGTYTVDARVIPLPGTLALLGSGLIGLTLFRRPQPR